MLTFHALPVPLQSEVVYSMSFKLLGSGWWDGVVYQVGVEACLEVGFISFVHSTFKQQSVVLAQCALYIKVALLVARGQAAQCACTSVAGGFLRFHRTVVLVATWRDTSSRYQLPLVAGGSPSRPSALPWWLGGRSVSSRPSAAVAGWSPPGSGPCSCRVRAAPRL